MALTDARQRVEASPDPSMATKKLATAERVSRQKDQEARLGGLVFTPETIPSNHLVDLFVEMQETGILSYVKPELCCSRAQEVSLIKKDPTVSTDASGLLKLGSKNAEPHCEANTELKLRQAWQRRNLAMDLAGLISFDIIEGWVQFLFLQLLKGQPKGFSRVSLQQILDCDRHLFTLASHRTMGSLQKTPGQPRPLDDTFELLKDSNEVLQYLMPLPATRVHEAPAPSGSRPEKIQKVDKTSTKGGGARLGMPARSADFPLGLPGLADHHQRRVDSANKLYSLAVEIILWCDKHGIVVSLENPANSWLWAVLVVLAREHSEEAARALNKLHKVLFHACCHGSTRRKHTGWLSTPGVFDALQAECQNDHPHEPWGVQWKSGTWVFDTASEAHYPHLLAQRATECLLRYFASKNISITKPLRLHDESVAVQGKQTKKHRPLIPEYCRILTIDNSMEPPEGAKLLPPHFQGGKAEEDVEMHSENLANVNKYGVFHSPQQFLAKAECVQHPMDSAEHLEEVTRYALDFNFRYPPGHVVRLERRKNLLQAKLLATRLAAEETALHDALPTSLAKVLEGKKLLLLENFVGKLQLR
eukprot:s4526_g5.t1